MEPFREFKKISPTAFNQAYLRTFYGIPHAREMAALINAEEERIKLYGAELHENLEDVPRFEARYKGGASALDDFCGKNPQAVILELGAGFSLHGAALTEKYPAVAYLETDLPEMIRLKENAIGALIDPSRGNLHFAAANALDAAAVEKALAVAAGHRPLAIYCEGFIDYLSLDEKRKLAAIIKRLLRKYGGVFITPDPSVSVERRAAQALFMKGAQERTKRVESVVGQRYDDHAFQNESDADLFFENCGFTVKKFPQPIALHSFAACRITADVTEKIIKDIRTYGKVWVMVIEPSAS